MPRWLRRPLWTYVPSWLYTPYARVRKWLDYHPGLCKILGHQRPYEPKYDGGRLPLLCRRCRIIVGFQRRTETGEIIQ